MKLFKLVSFLLVGCGIITDPDTSTDTPVSDKLQKCIFCSATPQNGFRIVFENDDFLAFHDHHPSSAHHMQVIPKAHHGNIKFLRKDDVGLLKSMEQIGHDLLDELDISPSNRRLGFHISPFNSIQHLHLHVLDLPITRFTRKWSYPVVAGKNGCEKGFSWFVDVRQAIEILERGGRIEVWSCRQ